MSADAPAGVNSNGNGSGEGNVHGKSNGNRNNRKIEEVIAALVLMLVGAVFVRTASTYGIGTSHEPGSGYFPMILGGLLIALSAVLLVRALRLRAGGTWQAWPLRQLLLIVGSLVAFGLGIGGIRLLAFEGLGLIPAMVIAVFIASCATRDLTLRQKPVLAVVLAAGSWVIFVVFLGLVIPLWPWSY